MAMNTPIAPASMYRDREGLGVWAHKGKVAAVGVGHSPTARRWDGTAENCIGAWTIQAIRNAIADSGIDPSQIDGLVLDTTTTTGAHWPAGRPIPEDVVNAFKSTDDPLDGIAKLSAEWLINNTPELTNVKFTMVGPVCMSNAINVAAQAVGDGLTTATLVIKAWHNLDGRYYQGGANAEPTISGNAKWDHWAGPASFGTAQQFQRYMFKYNKTHDMMAPFMINSRENGLRFPEGYWAQHRPEHLTHEDYVNARWVAKPANLYDNDIPLMNACAYIFTTADRAKDLRQKPVYILNHAKNPDGTRSITPTLEECEEATARTGRMLYEGAGITAADLSFENMYDGFSLFHVFHLEGLRYAGIQPGEALDFFASQDISIDGPTPISPSGGNIGSGRTRYWMHTDCIQQLQGRAGERQIKKDVHIGVSGGPMPNGGWFTVWGSEPD
ncbi:MAG: thiolase family protein [Dehalococcoidia bacterium]